MRDAVVVTGSAHARGAAQARLCPQSVTEVRAAYTARLEGARELFERRHVRNFLAAQWDFANTHDPDGIAEIAGIAEGYGLDAREVFAWLHVGQLNGLPDDGCSAWAFAHPEHGAIVVKNRDLRGPALPLQRVFQHCDPAWGGRGVLCVGSLGAPGAYSSGINSDGLALVDTQVVTRDQGVGMLRYFMMTRLLTDCASVEAALDMLHAMPQAGGGTLVIADRAGAMAAVEIGHSRIGVTRDVRAVARTNHFLLPGLAEHLLARPGDAGIDISHARLATLNGWLTGRQDDCPSEDEAAALMSGHDSEHGAGLCRHGVAGGSHTVSCAIFTCGPGRLRFSHGNPCDEAWTAHRCHGASQGR